jgi:hypothetical protein
VPNFFWANFTGKLLHGKIRVDSAYISGINILNLVNEKTAVTNSDGEFFILAKANY